MGSSPTSFSKANSAEVQETYGEVALASGNIPEGQKATAALALARSNYPVFQKSLIDEIEHPSLHP